MPRIEDVSGEYQLPPGALCFGPTGWVPILEEIVVESGMGLTEVLDIIWYEHQGLLGPGELTFALVGREPRPKGYLIFQPESDDAS